MIFDTLAVMMLLYFYWRLTLNQGQMLSLQGIAAHAQGGLAAHRQSAEEHSENAVTALNTAKIDVSSN